VWKFVKKNKELDTIGINEEGPGGADKEDGEK